VKLECNQTDAPVDAVDEEPEPNFGHRAARALANADSRPGDHKRPLIAQPNNTITANPGEVVYDIENDFPDEMLMAPAAMSDPADARLIAKNGTNLVEDVNNENGDEAKVDVEEAAVGVEDEQLPPPESLSPACLPL